MPSPVCPCSLLSARAHRLPRCPSLPTAPNAVFLLFRNVEGFDSLFAQPLDVGYRVAGSKVQFSVCYEPAWGVVWKALRRAQRVRHGTWNIKQSCEMSNLTSSTYPPKLEVCLALAGHISYHPLYPLLPFSSTLRRPLVPQALKLWGCSSFSASSSHRVSRTKTYNIFLQMSQDFETLLFLPSGDLLITLR